MKSCPKPVKVKKKKVKKPTLAKMRKILDRLWFEVIYLRDKGTCQKCGRKDTLSGHHIFGKKAYPAGRWNIDNGVLLCYAHHIHYAHSRPYLFQDWLANNKSLGWWNDFHKQAQASTQFRSCDFEQIKENLENEISKIMVSHKALSKDS